MKGIGHGEAQEEEQIQAWKKAKAEARVRFRNNSGSMMDEDWKPANPEPFYCEQEPQDCILD